MKICDSHAHIYPSKIAEKATHAIGDFYGINMNGIGDADALIKSGSMINVSSYLVCSVATKPEQVKSINDFIIKECSEHKEFIGLATMHQDMPDPEAEIERIASAGLKGIKLHHDFQKCDLDDPKFFPTYRKLSELSLPCLFHMGDNRYEYTDPTKLVHVMKMFPDLKVIASHFGGYREWSHALDVYERNENMFFDTSSSLSFIDPAWATEYINKFGADRFMFGSDFPMWNHCDELKLFNRLSLTDEQRELILHGVFDGLFCT